MKYIAALMIVSIFLAACSKPAPAPINWDMVVNDIARDAASASEYDHARK